MAKDELEKLIASMGPRLNRRGKVIILHLLRLILL